MKTKLGRLLTHAMDRMAHATTPDRKHFVAATLGSVDHDPEKLPVVVQFARQAPRARESWEEYRERVRKVMSEVKALLGDVMGVEAVELIAGNALKASLGPDQVRILGEHADVTVLELDPRVSATCLDDVQGDVDTAGFSMAHPGIDGSGVRVALLDSGADTQHAFLQIAQSISTCGEEIDIPGEHGTHCAGIIASQDTVFRGVAPGVTLLNVKVLQHNGTGQHTDIVQGVDEAIKLDADVLSMSLGFNHLPPWSNLGSGWACSDGSCALCTAVDNAVDMGKVVVVAAGNEHDRAEALRKHGFQSTFDTELCCPGQSRGGLTVGAITKRTFLPASFSSLGPSADGRAKPELCAPGVNISSTLPMPRDAQGNLVPNAPRSAMFGRMSGTSMATPIVAGAAALLIGIYRQQNVAWTPAMVRQELTTRGISPLPGAPVTSVGGGRLLLSSL